MKYIFFFITWLFVLPFWAQTTVYITSRADLASVMGFADWEGYASADNKRLGARFSFGLDFANKVTDNQVALTGLSYEASGFNYYQTFFGFDSVIQELADIGYSKGAHRYEFIAVPIGYRWYKCRRKVSIYGQLSLIPLAYLKTTVRSNIYERGGISRTSKYSERVDKFKAFHLATSAAVGLEWSINDGWRIGLQPTYRQHLTNVATSSPREWPWTAGLQFNIGWVLLADSPQ